MAEEGRDGGGGSRLILSDHGQVVSIVASSVKCPGQRHHLKPVWAVELTCAGL